MKNKSQKFTKVDEILMMLEEYRDQLTLVIVLNLLPIILTSKLDNYFPTIYLESRFDDFFNFLSRQNSLIDFCQVLFYTYLIGLIIQLGGAKIKKKWVYVVNTIFLFVATTYFWSILTLDSLLSLVIAKHYVFLFAIIFQIVFYFIAIRYFIKLFKFSVNKPKINHS